MENSQQIRAIIETPKGSSYKYDYSQRLGTFSLKKQLPKGMVFPYDFGFIPGTLGDDGDPLDIIIIADYGTFTGCSIQCRIIGALTCEQTERDGTVMRNDRYLAIPEISGQNNSIRTLSELPRSVVNELKSFFSTYNQLAGKSINFNSNLNADLAFKQIKRAREKALVNVRLELMLPINAPNGTPFAKSIYRSVEKELTERFGGLTAYSRTPVEGMWKPKEKLTEQPMIVYELLLADLDTLYWENLKQRLKSKFGQEEILIIHGPATKL